MTVYLTTAMATCLSVMLVHAHCPASLYPLHIFHLSFPHFSISFALSTDVFHIIKWHPDASTWDVTSTKGRKRKLISSTANIRTPFLQEQQVYVDLQLSYLKYKQHGNMRAYTLGLPTVPDFLGCPGFVPCCPTSRKEHPGTPNVPDFKVKSKQHK